MARSSNLTYKAALVEMFAGFIGPVFHVTAMLPPKMSRAMLEDCLRAWLARVDRFYLGRNWQRKPGLRAQGVVFFETRPHPHAHLVIRPPVGASPLHFQLNAPYWFTPHPDDLLRPFWPAPVTLRGRMLVQRIGPTSADLERVVRYDAKETEYRDSAIGEWKFLADLSRR